MTNEKTPEPKNNKEPSEQALLTEYQVCQQDSNTMIRTHWTVVNIFIGVNTALIGAVAYMLNNSTYSNSTRWIVLFLGLLSIAVFISLCKWLNRVNECVKKNEKVMRDIESALHSKVRETPQGNGSTPIKAVYVAFIILWIAAIVGAFIFNC